MKTRIENVDRMLPFSFLMHVRYVLPRLDCCIDCRLQSIYALLDAPFPDIPRLFWSMRAFCSNVLWQHLNTAIPLFKRWLGKQWVMLCMFINWITSKRSSGFLYNIMELSELYAPVRNTKCKYEDKLFNCVNWKKKSETELTASVLKKRSKTHINKTKQDKTCKFSM